MELNKNSWHSKLYTYIYNKSTPDNLCGYFWGLLFAILVFPLLFPFGYLIKHIDTNAPIFPNIFINIFGSLLTFCCLYFPIVHNDFMPLFILGFFITIIIVIFLFRFLYNYIYNKNKYKKRSKLSKEITEIKSIISESIKAFKGKYCPKITWKND